jgi:hypothetical protein
MFVDNKGHSGFGFENNPNFGHFLMKPAYKPRLFRTPNARRKTDVAGVARVACGTKPERPVDSVG